jgi:hypothetical protein
MSPRQPNQELDRMFKAVSRRPDEQVVLDRFAEYLKRETGMIWNASKDEVPTLKNRKMYDCEFTCPGEVPIAVDICALFPLGSDHEYQAKLAKFIDRLEPELQRAKLGGLMIQAPTVRKEYARPAWPRRFVDRLQGRVNQLPVGEHLEVEGFRIERVSTNSDPSYFAHSNLNASQPVEAAGHPLLCLLQDKHDQLDVDGHKRFLILVNKGHPTSAGDVSAACAFVDFRKYQNFNRIYFEELSGAFTIVYEKQAWFAMESARLSEDTEMRRIVTRWIEARLFGKWPGALETTLEICCHLHDAEWLSVGGRNLLQLEVHLFLQECEWNTPRKLWELFHGAVPREYDLRRRSRPAHRAAIQQVREEW